MQKIITSKNLEYWLALTQAPGLGPVKFLELWQSFPNLQEIFNLSPSALQNYGLPEATIAAIKQPDWKSVERALIWAQQPNCTILTCQDESYPPLLRAIPASLPPVLYVQGQVDLLVQPQIALVGSRNPTPSGKENAYHFAEYFVGAGLVVTSGLALGIDAASHQGALAGKGKTIAVVGTGLDRVYPAQHKALAEKIVEQGGTVVSEFGLGTLPKQELPLKKIMLNN